MKRLNSSLFTLALALVFSLTAFAQGSVTVHGSATSYDMPFAVKATIYVRSLEKDADDAFDETDKAITNVVEELMEHSSVSSVQVSDMRIDPEFDNMNGRYAFASYQELSFTMDSLEAFNQVLKEVMGEGANGIINIAPMIKNGQQVEESLLRAAIADARSRAEAIASASGKSLGEVLSVVVLENESDRVYTQADKMTEYKGLTLSKLMSKVRIRVEFAMQ